MMNDYKFIITFSYGDSETLHIDKAILCNNYTYALYLGISHIKFCNNNYLKGSYQIYYLVSNNNCD